MGVVFQAHKSLKFKWLTSATNRAFSIQHTCGLSTTPTLLDATVHTQTQCRKVLSSHNNSSAVEYCYTMLQRIRGMCYNNNIERALVIVKA